MNLPCVRAKSLRIKAGLSLRELAKKASVSASTISRFERGNLDVLHSTVLAIFEALGEPLDNPSVAFIELTEAEIDYIWLLTALDAMRIQAMQPENKQDYHYKVRHSVRTKLFESERG